MKIRIKKKIKIIFLIIVVFLLVLSGLFIYELSPVSSNKNDVSFTVTKGSTYISISKNLKEKNLIKSELFYKIYLKLVNKKGLEAGVYTLKESMSVNDIINSLSKGSNYNPDTVKITIPEGKKVKEIASIIALSTNHLEKDILSVMDDYNFINDLINKYWFIKEDIKASGIGHPLEGYLFPDTYELLNKDVKVESIIYKMLDRTDTILTKYKSDIEKSKYSIHELLTLASMVELEGLLDEDRALIAGVFYNRLDINMALGSDVTSYYGYEIKLNKDLSKSEKIAALYDNNPYNTRGDLLGLPIGPICNPGEASIKAAIYPKDSDYIYFIANTCDESDHKTYFTVTYQEHLKNKDTYLTCEN